jgi:hypothetical protein
MRIIKLLPVIALAVSILSCNNGKQESTKTVVDTVKVIDHTTVQQPVAKEKQPAKTQTQPAKDKPVVTPPAKPAPDWRAMMKEYHELLCKEHKGTGTTDDKIREAELGKELKDIPKTLNSDEKFYFTTEMARTINMQSCQ